jgi:hypothetical protein
LQGYYQDFVDYGEKRRKKMKIIEIDGAMQQQQQKSPYYYNAVPMYVSHY